MWGAMESFPFLGRRGKALTDGQEVGSPRTGASRAPSLKVSLERKVYRPGDTVVATIEVANEAPGMVRDLAADAVLMADMLVEVRGIEKIDPTWLITPKPPSGPRQRKGERTILKSPSSIIVSDVLISPGSSSSYMVRTTLPRVLPPTLKGDVVKAVRYFYYITAAIRWSWCAQENGHSSPPHATTRLERLEVRTFLPIWTLPHTNGLTADELHYGQSGIVPPYALEIEIQWKEKGSENPWAWAADANIRNGEDRVSTPKSDGGSTFTSPTKSISLDPFDRSYSIASRAIPLQLDPSFSTPASSRRGDSLSTSASMADLSARSKQPGCKRACSFDSLTNEALLASVNGHHANGHSHRVEEEALPESPRSPAAVSYSRGKSYNIRMDDEVLVKFSPKNPTSNYHFGDMVAGTLQFFHNDRRRCLEVLAVLETREILNPAAVHPSRKNSSTITKAYSEYFEIVNDVISTQFLFSIPLDGPASITTPLLSLEWILRFEFIVTPLNKEWKSLEHPLLIDVNERRKGEWSLPIVVHATPPKKLVLPEAEKPTRSNSWARSPGEIYKSLFDEYPQAGDSGAPPASGSM